jgi:hypothetical protein
MSTTRDSGISLNDAPKVSCERPKSLVISLNIFAASSFERSGIRLYMHDSKHIFIMQPFRKLVVYVRHMFIIIKIVFEIVTD